VKQRIRIVVEGPVGNLEINFGDESVLVYAWPGSTLSIHHEDDLLWSTDLAAPLLMPAATKRE
jgi:hypothetical protein